MIDGISNGFQAMGANNQAAQRTQLSDDQKTQLLDILSKYDPESMTDADKSSLMEDLKSSGIRPSETVHGIIESAGFEVEEPPQGPPPGGKQGPPPPKPDFVNEAVSKYENGGLSDEDLEELIAQLKDWNEPPQGILLDQTS